MSISLRTKLNVILGVHLKKGDFLGQTKENWGVGGVNNNRAWAPSGVLSRI